MPCKIKTSIYQRYYVFALFFLKKISAKQMSRIEHCGKNVLANCFRNFGRKDLKDSAVKNV